MMPWAGMRRCLLLDNGTVNYYLHPDDSTKKEDGTAANLTGADGQVMVEIPKFWYKTEVFEDGYRWYVSDQPADGFKVHPAFVRNGVEKDRIYLGAFEAYNNGGKLESLPNKTPTVSQTISTFRALAQARGTGWEQQDFLTTCAVQLLYLVEYGSFDTQTMIGQGIVNDTAAHPTGETLKLGNHSGEDTNKDVGKRAVSYRGIENFWGNIWTFVDGINIRDNIPYIADHGFQSDLFSTPYRSAGVTLWNEDGYPGDIAVSDALDYAFLASTGGGSETSKLHDYYSQSSGGRVARCSGYWSNGGRAGGFYWVLDGASWNVSGGIGGRLLYIG